ncbi:antA/AntB antirepressor family protein [Chryseobacterium indologenes]|uniref:AntA/AntB antirepressor domain-containing protein n=1 Tax=Chryseobacterium indologenes TaxID=253 RepID=A0A0N0IWB0_CHRID|nr:antA/AntB antirepressor family protein [Chryseobacterium indologenes]KPE51243.1 hypothetical protein AOB46_11295 [Chryseobacterium indologenes]
MTNITNFGGKIGNELIRISEQNGKQAVSARELYEFLGYDLKNWKRWYLKNIVENQFAVENEDYQTFVIERNGNETLDFALSIDLSKKISMMAKTVKGEEARDYFINCENNYKNSIQIFQNDPFIQLRMNQIQQQQQIVQLETKVQEIEAKTTTRPDYFSVMGYAILNKITVGLTLASTIGRKAAAICRKNNLPTDEVPDPRFGKVKLYPRNVLEDVFNQTVFA